MPFWSLSVYDKASNETSSSDYNGTVTYAYDPSGVLIQIGYPNNSATNYVDMRVNSNGLRTDEWLAADATWTTAQLKAIRAELSVDIAAMQVEYERSLAELDELQQAGTDGAGDDQADAGAKTFDREQELSIAANRFDLLSQMMHAVERIDHGTYGYCEVCGNAIPRVRLQAFPMATLDVACKQREERR